MIVENESWQAHKLRSRDKVAPIYDTSSNCTIRLSSQKYDFHVNMKILVGGGYGHIRPLLWTLADNGNLILL